MLHSFRLNGVSLYDALGWQAVTERVLALPVSERLFSTYHSLLNNTRRLEHLDPLFEELSAALTQCAGSARSSHTALESWVQRHSLCQASVLPVIDGFAPHTVAAALDVFAHAAPWELSALPSRLVDHFEGLLKASSGVTVLHSSLHPSSVLAAAVPPGISVVKGDLSSLAECVEASAGLSCVFLAHLAPDLAPDPLVVSSIADLLDSSLSLPLRMELAVVLSQEKPMLSL